MKPHPRRTLAITPAGFAVACLALSMTPGFWPFVAMVHRVGVRVGVVPVGEHVVLQQATDPSMQGRVMALHQMAWFGSTPIGALLMGCVIQVSSPRVPFALGGLSALICAAAVIEWHSRRRYAMGYGPTEPNTIHP